MLRAAVAVGAVVAGLVGPVAGDLRAGPPPAVGTAPSGGAAVAAARAPAPEGGTARPGPVSRAEAEAAYRRWLKAVRLIEIRFLRAGTEAGFAEGRRRLLAIRDDAALGPMVDVLYGPKPRYRGLLLEALSARAREGSRVALAYLQEMAVGDGSRVLRRRAVETLKGHSGDPPTERLLTHLALDEVPVLRDRAAEALAELGDRRAVWVLVERLVTEEVRLVGAEAWSASMQLDIRAQLAGIPAFRQTVVTAAVPGGGIATATIDLPQVEIIDVATTVAMTEHHDPVPRYARVRTRHPAVLAALKRLTGKDFGYDQAAWRRWLRSREADGVVPAWRPLRLKAGL